MERIIWVILIITGMFTTSCISINEKSVPYQKEISSKESEEPGLIQPDFKLVSENPWKIKLSYKQYYNKEALVKYQTGENIIREWNYTDTDYGKFYHFTDFPAMLFKHQSIPSIAVILTFPFFTVDFFRSMDSTNDSDLIEKKVVLKESLRYEENLLKHGNMEILAKNKIIIPIEGDGSIRITDDVIDKLFSQSIYDKIKLYNPDLKLIHRSQSDL